MNIICFSVFLGGGGAPSWRSWGHLGSKLEVLGPSWLQVGRSWGHLGSNLEGLGSILLPTWGHLGSKLGIWRASWLQDRRQIASCMQLGQHSKSMEKSMKIIGSLMFLGGRGSMLEVLGPSWLQVGGLGAILAPSWGSCSQVGSKLGGLAAIVAPSWRSWGHLRSNLEGLGTILPPTWGALLVPR